MIDQLRKLDTLRNFFPIVKFTLIQGNFTSSIRADFKGEEINLGRASVEVMIDLTEKLINRNDTSIMEDMREIKELLEGMK